MQLTVVSSVGMGSRVRAGARLGDGLRGKVRGNIKQPSSSSVLHVSTPTVQTMTKQCGDRFITSLVYSTVRSFCSLWDGLPNYLCNTHVPVMD